jgi:SAM-dependent methyltransferase
MQQYYAARAREYDSIYLKPERQHDLRRIESWLPTVLSGRSILEVACGTGYWTQFIAPVAKNIHAIDSSPETLAVARERVPAQHVQFVEGDAYCLPLLTPRPSGGFAGFWLSHVPQASVRSFLRSFNKALCHGAKVVLVDNRFVEGSSTPISHRDAEGDTYQMRPLADGTSHQILKNFYTEEALRAVLAGIADDFRFHGWEYFWALEFSVVASC